MYYTLGQRSGIGIGGIRDADDSPWYVAGKDLTRNVLQVVQGHDHPALMSAALTATDLQWVAGVAPLAPLLCSAKTRYRQPDQACTLGRGLDGMWCVRFDQPQRAVTLGQYAVFYAGDACLGGGVIAAVEPWPAAIPTRRSIG
jgi:tRNA-specific 2-thiouridylase